MPKPIVYIKIPLEMLEGRDIAQSLQEATVGIEKKFSNEYFVLVAPTYDTEFDFKIWYDKDFEEKKYEEIRGLVSDQMEQLKTKSNDI